MIKLELEGVEELLDKVNKLGVSREKIKSDTLKEVGKVVKETIEKKAPRSNDTKEHMADNILFSDLVKEDGIDYVKVGPNKGENSEFFYSKFTEWGTSKILAQHWAEKSVTENKREINKIISAKLRKGLDEFDK